MLAMTAFHRKSPKTCELGQFATPNCPQVRMFALCMPCARSRLGLAPASQQFNELMN